MRRLQWFVFLGVAIPLTLALLILAGCGGGGGPITQPETGTPNSSIADFIQLLPAVQRSATTIGNSKCESCHTDTHKDPDPVEFSKTIHASKNVTCESCHGPGSVHAAAPAKTNILTGQNATSPTVCGQCHGPTHDQFETSRHASPVADVITAAQTNPSGEVPTCFRCHSAAFRANLVDDPLAHGVSPTDIDNNIKALTVDQLGTWPIVTHESASCGTCHNPHKNTGVLSSQGTEQYLRRATFSSDTSKLAPGTAVKDYTTINHMCGTCHNGRGVNPSDATLKASVSRPGMHNGPQFNTLLGIGGSETVTTNGAATSLPPSVRTSSHSLIANQCVHCHLPAQRHTFTVSLDTSCAPCHTAADAAAREDSLKTEILSDLLTLKNRMETWSSTNFNGDPDQWDYTSNISLDLDSTGQPKVAVDPKQANIPIEVKRARHNYWFITKDQSFGIHNSVYIRYMLDIANKNLDSLNVPRSAPARSTMSAKQMLQMIAIEKQKSKKSAMGDQ